MKVYISGRITGNPKYMKQFAEAEEKTREYDIPCINPAKEPDPNKTWSDYMREDLALLLTCDTILMLKGWWRSRGARLERYIAKKLTCFNFSIHKNYNKKSNYKLLFTFHNAIINFVR